MRNLAVLLYKQGKHGEARQWRRKEVAARPHDRRPKLQHKGSGMNQKWILGWTWSKSGGNISPRLGKRQETRRKK
jgi:hypothetical protein